MNWGEWNEVNEEKAEYQEADEKNQEVDSRDRVLHTEKSETVSQKTDLYAFLA